ncbi:Polycomb protein eed-B like [Verticillium longisporum]|uniref:Polycomb protein eed-B like n=1 Tax=Verticillium longisporum TaxID=100787 RepID=A0A8I3AS67_VERLO|nr:Polycomb protein eed-B like [Verticillium longisporum]KAG7135193.1 Polycomb protein eed-B like [Verticillium longisporum]
MPASNPETHPYDLPKLRVSFTPEDDTRFLSQEDNVPEYFAVQFCPYQPVDADPVFAAVSKKHVLLCRLTANDDTQPYTIIKVIRDDDADSRNYTCTWSQDKETGKPYLCLSGEDAKIKIYDVTEGTLVNVLVGHGGDINDMVTSPINPLVIATASDDTTIRIWSLDPDHKDMPCRCILGGEGHQWSLLTLAFHDSGRYMLSAGHDQIVNLWTLPDLPTGTIQQPLEVHYPHFSTNEVHSGVVDCVAFFGDWILSRACHDDIIALWRIEGFSSKDPPPPPESAPTTINPEMLTRSAFTKDSPDQHASHSQYTRLLTFFTPGSGNMFFMRFKLHHMPGHHPVLAFCNANSKIFFWDLARITSYHDWTRGLIRANGDRSLRPERPAWLTPIVHRARPEGKQKPELTVRERKAADAPPKGIELIPGMAELYSKETLQSWDGKYNAGDPHTPLQAHRVESIGVKGFVGRYAAWSPSGEWCVIVGSINLGLILQRWAPA